MTCVEMLAAFTSSTAPMHMSVTTLAFVPSGRKDHFCTIHYPRANRTDVSEMTSEFTTQRVLDTLTAFSTNADNRTDVRKAKDFVVHFNISTTTASKGWTAAAVPKK